MNIEQLKKKTLLLTQTNPNSDFIYHDWIERGYCADILFKNHIKLVRAIRRIWVKNKWPLQWIWYGSWAKHLQEYEVIILHVGDFCLDVPQWIQKKFPNMRIICWYWNVVAEETLPEKISTSNVELWSFDFEDCEKYSMRKNVQYYCEPKEIEEQVEETDIYFIGHDVGRKEKIENIKKLAELQGIMCDFQIVKKKTFAIPYKEIQKAVMKSRAILEINREGQSGYTLRTMESLFFDKKLITNNVSILDAPFYRESNIFLIKDGNLDGLKEFLDIPYDKSVSIYKDDYKIDKWFLNFFK